MDLLSAVGDITSIISFLKEHRKDKKELLKDKQSRSEEIHHNRPEFDIVNYKDYLARTNYGIKKHCDIELFVAHIDSTTVKGKKKDPIVDAYYAEDHFNSDEWCCVIYTLKNAGKTDIDSLDIICTFARDTCIFPTSEAVWYANNHLLNYSECYDKKIRVGNTITLKFCYHKDAIIVGPISSIIHIGIVDDNGRHWVQPLFAPEEKIYSSRSVTAKEYADEMNVHTAELCFANPDLW